MQLLMNGMRPATAQGLDRGGRLGRRCRVLAQGHLGKHQGLLES
jgi:hypothetical protein